MTADSVDDARVQIEFCATTNLELQTELDRALTRVTMEITEEFRPGPESDGSEPAPETTVRELDYQDSRTFDSPCISSRSHNVYAAEAADGAIDLRATVTIYRLPGEDPVDVEISTEIQQR